MQKKYIAASGLLALAMTAPAAPALAGKGSPTTSGNKLQCFDGSTDYPGVVGGRCTLGPNGTATLNNDSTDPDPADPSDQYSGVYVLNTNLGGKRLSDVNQLSFRFTGSAATGGSPRFSVPIDTDGDLANTEGYAFIDGVTCNDGTGTVDAFAAGCTVWFGSVGYAGWTDFAAANPTYRVSNAIPFVIADQNGTYTLSDVRIGRAGAKTPRR